MSKSPTRPFHPAGGGGSGRTSSVTGSVTRYLVSQRPPRPSRLSKSSKTLRRRLCRRGSSTSTSTLSWVGGRTISPARCGKSALRTSFTLYWTPSIAVVNSRTSPRSSAATSEPKSIGSIDP